MGNDDRSRIAKEFRGFVAAAAAAPSPLYAELSAAVADDDEILDLLLGLPRPKQQPMLLFGAITFLDGPPAGPEQLHAAVRNHRDRIREVMLTRFTQTNEPARCAVHLLTSTTGAVPVPERLPHVAARVGVDQNPLDPADLDDRAWLRALIWPGPNAAPRLERLDAAARIAAREPVTVLTGDLIDRLPEAVDRLPPDCAPVVFHTAVLAYLERGRRERFVALVNSLGVRWIAQEAAGIVPGIDPDLAGPESFVLPVDGRAVAVTAPHGGRIDWL